MPTSEVVAPTPGLVMKINVTEGSTVSAGDTVAILQSMKMEISLLAETSGKVTRVLAKQGEEVGIGQPLVEIESQS